MRCPVRARFSRAGRYATATFLPGTVFPGTIQVASGTFPVSSVNDLQNIARSWYDAGYMSLRRRYSRGLSLLANYTFAKNLSNAPEFRSPMAESAIPQNDNDLAAEKGPACDVRHRLSLSAVYELPALRRRGLAARASRATGGFPPSTRCRAASRLRFRFLAIPPTREPSWVRIPFARTTRGSRFSARHANHGGVVQPSLVRHSSRIHLRQCGTEYRLRAWHANDGSRAGPLIRAGRTAAHGASGANPSTR